MERFTDLGMAQMAQADSFAPTAPIAPAFADQSSDESAQALSALAMRCGGCGAKVGASVLAPALAALVPLHNPAVLVGLQSPDDAAIVQVPTGYAMVHTVDFFRAFVDDPYRFGKIAANHALGDIFAMGAQPQSATAIATVPPGLDRQTQATLSQMMTGAVDVLNAAGCTLVGGHTGEGQELALGFAINGLVAVSPQGELQGVMRKAGMQASDVLILTKPLGTGTLFAAHALGLARGRWIEAALRQMEQSNQVAAQTLHAHGARACTDVTGFGLLGHLVEMTRPSGVDAEINLAALPVLDGALACLGLGHVSSLHQANARMRSALANPDTVGTSPTPRLSLLFDPQTAGGLLASVPADQADACLLALQTQGYDHSAIIGRVLPKGQQSGPIRLLDDQPQIMEQ
jgi:selenide,water dikinase